MDLASGIDLNRALRSLGAVLAHRGHRFEGVVVGGSGLFLLGILDRPTKDVDLLGLLVDGRLEKVKPLPVSLVDAVQAVAEDLGLAPDWLSTGPMDLLDFGLPVGFLQRCEQHDFGGLVVFAASRHDQIHFKLYAAVDQGPHSKHAHDLRLLKPTLDELCAAGKWCRTHDSSEAFAQQLDLALTQFSAEVEGA